MGNSGKPETLYRSSAQQLKTNRIWAATTPVLFSTGPVL
jgi:hypothetical protein